MATLDDLIELEQSKPEPLRIPRLILGDETPENNALHLKNIGSDVNPLLRRQLVESITGDSKSTLYRKIEKGLFPKPVCTGRNKNGGAAQVRWPANEVAAVNQARIAGKTEEEIKKLVAELEVFRAEG